MDVEDNVVIEDSLFQDNNCSGDGGAVQHRDSGFIRIIRSRFLNNQGEVVMTLWKQCPQYYPMC